MAVGFSEGTHTDYIEHESWEHNTTKVVKCAKSPVWGRLICWLKGECCSITCVHTPSSLSTLLKGKAAMQQCERANCNGNTKAMIQIWDNLIPCSTMETDSTWFTVLIMIWPLGGSHDRSINYSFRGGFHKYKNEKMSHDIAENCEFHSTDASRPIRERTVLRKVGPLWRLNGT